MRSLLIVMCVASVAGADPMQPVADVAAVCTTLRRSGDAQDKCESAARSTIRDVGTVDAYVVRQPRAVRYAIVVATGGKLWMSAPVELATPSCATKPCEVLDDHKPALRAVFILGKPGVALAIDRRHHREATDAPVERWTATTLIACTDQRCTTRSWGARGNPCKVAVTTTTIVASCETAGAIALDDDARPLDEIMDDAIRAYDRADFDKAGELARAALAKDPANVRMLRLVVSVSCVSGEREAAQRAFVKLPARDRAQMKTRCDRYGVALSDP